MLKSWLVMFFRSAIRAEVDRCLAERGRRVRVSSRVQLSDESVESIARWLGERDLEPIIHDDDQPDVVAIRAKWEAIGRGRPSGTVLPFPSKPTHEPTPPAAA